MLCVWLAFMLAAVCVTLVTAKSESGPHYEKMTEARRISAAAMEAVKTRKIELGIEISELDILSTGMLGEENSAITTTIGSLEAKRTTFNPDWAAVFVGMFVRAGLRENDQVCMVFSGSFPALDISAMAAADAYGLKTCIMASIGASNYGANNINFTFFDMTEYLAGNGFLSRRIDYVSLGGNYDVMDLEMEFYATEINEIRTRIEASDSVFIYEPDFGKNINLRLDYLKKDVPNVKFMLNVGGSLIGLGTGSSSLYRRTGYLEPGYIKGEAVLPPFLRNTEIGLVEYYHKQGVPAANILDIKRLSAKYALPYDPQVIPEIGSAEIYYSQKYIAAIPFTAVGLSFAAGAGYCFYRKRYDKNHSSTKLCNI